jgi:hypothetical protein
MKEVTKLKKEKHENYGPNGLDTTTAATMFGQISGLKYSKVKTADSQTIKLLRICHLNKPNLRYNSATPFDLY